MLAVHVCHVVLLLPGDHASSVPCKQCTFVMYVASIVAARLIYSVNCHFTEIS